MFQKNQNSSWNRIGLKFVVYWCVCACCLCSVLLLVRCLWWCSQIFDMCTKLMVSLRVYNVFQLNTLLFFKFPFSPFCLRFFVFLRCSIRYDRKLFVCVCVLNIHFFPAFERSKSVHVKCFRAISSYVKITQYAIVFGPNDGATTKQNITKAQTHTYTHAHRKVIDIKWHIRMRILAHFRQFSPARNVHLRVYQIQCTFPIHENR